MAMTGWLVCVDVLRATPALVIICSPIFARNRCFHHFRPRFGHNSNRAVHCSQSSFYIMNVCVCLCASWVATHFCLLPFGICVPFRTFITVIALSRYALFLSPFYLFFGGIDSGMWYDDVAAIDQKTWHKCAHVNLKNHSTENYGVTSNALSHCITTTKWKTHIQNVYTPFWIFHATKLQWRIMCSLIYMTLSNW